MRRLCPSVARVALLCLGLSACDGSGNPTDVVERLDVGIIALSVSDQPSIEVPDTVDAAVPFTVTVTTYGNGCWREGRTESVVIAGRPVITPLDWVTSGAACDDILLEFEHNAEVAIAEPGTGLVMVRGRIGASGPIQTLQRELWVR